MNRIWALGVLSVIIVLGLSNQMDQLLADDSSDSTPKPKYEPILNRWFNKKKPTDPPPPTAKIPPGVQTAAIYQKEQDLYMQRMALCDQIRVIAQDKDDQALLAKADALQAKAFEIYNRRVAHLPGAVSHKNGNTEVHTEEITGTETPADPKAMPSTKK